MTPLNRKKFSKTLGNILLYLLIIYIFFLSGKIIWSNYELKKEIEKINQEISQIEKKNQDLSNLIIYYQSNSFREVLARQKLDLKKPNEKVVNVPVKSLDFNEELESDRENISSKEQNDTRSNFNLWLEFIFH